MNDNKINSPSPIDPSQITPNLEKKAVKIKNQSEEITNKAGNIAE